MSKRDFRYFVRNHVQSDPFDGFGLTAADAAQVNTYLQRILKSLKGGLFRKAIDPVSLDALAADLYLAYGGRMPKEVADRICRADILAQFGVGVRQDGTIYDADAEAGTNAAPTSKSSNVVGDGPTEISSPPRGESDPRSSAELFETIGVKSRPEPTRKESAQEKLARIRNNVGKFDEEGIDAAEIELRLSEQRVKSLVDAKGGYRRSDIEMLARVTVTLIDSYDDNVLFVVAHCLERFNAIIDSEMGISCFKDTPLSLEDVQFASLAERLTTFLGTNANRSANFAAVILLFLTFLAQGAEIPGSVIQELERAWRRVQTAMPGLNFPVSLAGEIIKPKRY